MTIGCFGIAREIAGGATIELDEASGITVGELRHRLIDSHPALGDLISFAIARNEAYATDEEIIQAGDEIVIIPPVSGG